MFTKRSVQLTVWSPFRGVGSRSKTTIPYGTVALFDPPPASRRSTLPRSRGVKFDLPDKATTRSVERTVLWKCAFRLDETTVLVARTAGPDPAGDPNKADRPPWGPFFGPQKVL